jgi:type I restriction enzyme S subunit
MGKYKKYEVYKDSGIEWIGEVPEEWGNNKLKYIVTTTKGFAFKSELFKEQGIPIIKTTDIKQGRIEKTITYIDEELKDKFKSVVLKENDILMSTVGSKPEVVNSAVGQIGKVQKEYVGALLNQNAVILRINDKNILNEYLFYFISSNNYRKYLDLYAHGTANQASLSLKEILDFKMCLPDINIQRQIANFLDQKISEIDSLIADKEKLINLLEEKRQAIITETVTKGLNLNVKIKDSGVEWIGKVPHEWEVKKLKYIGEAIIGLTYSPNDVTDESGILVLRSSNVKDNQIVFGDNVYVNTQIKDKLITKEGDILICSRNGSRALIGKNAYIAKGNEGHSFGAFMIVFRSRYNKYLSYVFNSTLFKNQSGSFLTSTVNQLTINNLYSFLIPMPTAEEQILICSYLDVKTSEIDTLKGDIKLQIEKLKEYRQSLISEVVTGKIDVRDYYKEA